MQRRHFVLNMVKSIPLVVLSPSLLFACEDVNDKKPFDNQKTILVIGAGISGLTAAKILKNKGYIVIVIESQSKVGGRIKTDRSLGFAFDEGASWIHGPEGNPITNLANDAGANTYLTNDDNLKVFNAIGTAYSDVFLEAQYTAFENALDAIRSAGTFDQPFETIFNQLYPTQANVQLWKFMLSAYLEFDTGGDIANLSSKYFDDDEVFAGDDLIITDGYDKLTDYLAQDLDIRLNTKVLKIDYSGIKPTVQTNQNTYNADCVIVTVPLGVLKSNAIIFVPELPIEKTDAIQKTNMGNVNKFVLTWNVSFWDTTVQYIGFTPETKGKFNYFLNLKKFLPSTNALMTFAFGNFATQTESMTDSEITNEIMQHLRIVYGNNIPNPTNMLRTKWAQDPNSFGAYSFATKGSSSNTFKILSKPLNNNIFFAGEHTNIDYRGTVHGAYLSGQRVANEIMDM